MLSNKKAKNLGQQRQDGTSILFCALGPQSLPILQPLQKRLLQAIPKQLIHHKTLATVTQTPTSAHTNNGPVGSRVFNQSPDGHS